MNYSFRVFTTPAAKFRTGLKMTEIVRSVVTKAELLSLEPTDCTVFDVPDLELRVVARFASRKIHIMTREQSLGYEQLRTNAI